MDNNEKGMNHPKKTLLTLMLVVSFVLGMLTGSFALAGDWYAPKYGEKAPTLKGAFNCPGTPGRMFYQLPDGWKLVGIGKSNMGNPVMELRKKAK